MPAATPLLPVSVVTTSPPLVAGHAAVAPVYFTGPHAAGAADTDMLRARPAFVLNPDTASDFLAQEPAGRYTLQGFHHHFLEADLASGDRCSDRSGSNLWPRGGVSHVPGTQRRTRPGSLEPDRSQPTLRPRTSHRLGCL